MAESVFFKKAAGKNHVTVAPRVIEPSSDGQASRHRSPVGLLRPSQVPVPSGATRPGGALIGAAPFLARPSAVPTQPVLDVLTGSGQSLATSLKEDMEARLGADFSNVRVHTDSAARASAAELGARAYTCGSHIVIGAGELDRHALAHELTHVVQQRQGPVAGTDHGSGIKVSDPFDVFEQAAEANASRVIAMGAAVPSSPAVHGSAGPSQPFLGTTGAAPTVQRGFMDQLSAMVNTVVLRADEPSPQSARQISIDHIDQILKDSNSEPAY